VKSAHGLGDNAYQGSWPERSEDIEKLRNERTKLLNSIALRRKNDHGNWQRAEVLLVL